METKFPDNVTEKDSDNNDDNDQDDDDVVDCAGGYFTRAPGTIFPTSYTSHA